jgi:hypothetical protein
MPRYHSVNAAYNPNVKAPREEAYERWTCEGSGENDVTCYCLEPAN